MSVRTLAAVAALALLANSGADAAAAAAAATPAGCSLPAAASAGAAAPMNAELLTTGLYLVTGGGANSLVRFSARGLVLVDAKAAGQAAALKSQVRRVSRLSDMPVRALVLTGADDAHAGNAAVFMAAGARVLAPRSVLVSAPGLDAATGAPPVGFDDAYTLRIGGVEVRVIDLGAGHGGTTAAVLFPDLKVVTVGDLYRAGGPGCAASDDLDRAAWSAALARVLALDFDRAVPADGPPVSRADLLAFKARLDAAAAGRP